MKGNELSVKIASATKKDSIAMMTFTFITVLFLPGTYISSLLSTSMFDWQTSVAESGVGSPSNYFWIYWAISIPLTILIMWIWRNWFRYADGKWKEEIGIPEDPKTVVPWYKNIWATVQLGSRLLFGI